MEHQVLGPVHETHLIYEPPSGELAILLNLGLVDRLQNLIRQAPDHEIGGILLGRRDTQGTISGRRIVVIDNFEPLESEHLRGPAYSVSKQDTKNLATALSRAAAANGNVPVGFFRSHLRKGLYLDEADFSMFREYFSGDSDVFLVARPEAKGVPVAGFFFWEDGVLERRTSYAQFPLDRRSLETGGYSLLRGSLPVPESSPPRRVTVGENRRRRIVYGAIGGALILSALVWAAILHLPGRQEDSSSLSLSVERKGNELRLMWDPNAPAVQHANSGILWISDGEKRRGLEFNAARLKSGSFLYTPESDVVNFRLDLLKVLAQGSESVRYVADRGTTPPPAPPPQKTNVAAAIAAAPPRTLQPAQPQAQVRPEPVVSITTQPLPSSRVREWIAKVPVVRTLQRNRRRAGNGFIPPRTIREVMPRVSSRLARELPGDSRVDLKISLDANGIVREIDLLSPGDDDRLAKLAADALRQWRFEPARMHDKPVACDLLATLNVRKPAPSALLAKQE